MSTEKPDSGSNRLSQTESVKVFFDSTSPDYKNRYKNERSVFLAHFFNTRLTHAAGIIAANRGPVLDIGAGTGELYTVLTREHGLNADQYIGIDISPGMLAASEIPEAQQRTGSLLSLARDLEGRKFRNFAMLGVTTYIPRIELARSLQVIRELSAPDARLIITFTNRYSIERVMQLFIALAFRTLSVLSSRRQDTYVAAQTFSRTFCSYTEAVSIMKSYGELEHVIWLNQTVTPLNRLFPRASIWLEKAIGRLVSHSSMLLSPISSDVLLVVRYRTLESCK